MFIGEPGTNQALLESDFVTQQKTRLTYAGAVVAGIAPIYIDPTRLGQVPMSSRPDRRADLRFQELVAGGRMSIVGEFLV
jgi:hypothetical protein